MSTFSFDTLSILHFKQSIFALCYVVRLFPHNCSLSTNPAMETERSLEGWWLQGNRAREVGHWQIAATHTHTHTHTHTVSSQGDSQYPSIIMLSRCPNTHRLPLGLCWTWQHTHTHTQHCALHCSGEGWEGPVHNGKRRCRGQRRTRCRGEGSWQMEMREIKLKLNEWDVARSAVNWRSVTKVHINKRLIDC